MHQLVAEAGVSSRRWWVLAIVVTAQFMFGLDIFIVNVAIPTIAAELHAGPAEIESIVAVYLIAYATLIVTGGRLGDIGRGGRGSGERKSGNKHDREAHRY